MLVPIPSQEEMDRAFKKVRDDYYREALIAALQGGATTDEAIERAKAATDEAWPK